MIFMPRRWSVSWYKICELKIINSWDIINNYGHGRKSIITCHKSMKRSTQRRSHRQARYTSLFKLLRNDRPQDRWHAKFQNTKGGSKHINTMKPWPNTGIILDKGESNPVYTQATNVLAMGSLQISRNNLIFIMHLTVFNNKALLTPLSIRAK